MLNVLWNATLALLSLFASLCVLVSLDSSKPPKRFERTGDFGTTDFPCVCSVAASLILSAFFDESLVARYGLGSSLDSSSLASSIVATAIVFVFGESIYGLDFS